MRALSGTTESEDLMRLKGVPSPCCPELRDQDIGSVDVRLSTKGRYAVMAMVDLAMNSNGIPVALSDIAGRQEISLSYLEQLFAKLRRGWLVKSVRGPGGGYLLARPVNSIRISDIIMAVDELIRVTRCRPGIATGCHIDNSRCLTHDLWEELGNQIHLYLSAMTLDDVVNKRVTSSSQILPAVQIQTEGRIPAE